MLSKGGKKDKMSEEKKPRYVRDAEVMLELLTHPERFCPICHKRNGVCVHTGGRGKEEEDR